MWKSKSTQEGLEDEKDVSKETVHTDTAVPIICVRLLQSVKLLPCQSLPVFVKVEHHDDRKPLLLEYDKEVEDATGLQVEDALLNPSWEGVAEVVVTNPSGFTQVAVMKVSVWEELWSQLLLNQLTKRRSPCYLFVEEPRNGKTEKMGSGANVFALCFGIHTFRSLGRLDC